MNKAWREEYEKCGCVSDCVPLRRDLLGYCPQHGNNWRARYRTTADDIAAGREELSAVRYERARP